MSTHSANAARPPATRTVWKLVALLALGYFFELCDLLYTGYVAPGLVKSGMMTNATAGLFGPRTRNVALESISH